MTGSFVAEDAQFFDHAAKLNRRGGVGKGAYLRSTSGPTGIANGGPYGRSPDAGFYRWRPLECFAVLCRRGDPQTVSTFAVRRAAR